MKIKRQRSETYVPRANGKQKFYMPSETVPDESYSIREILERFTRGVDPMLTKLGSYDMEDPDEKLTDEMFNTNGNFKLIDDLTDVDDIKNFISNTKHQEKLLREKLAKIEEERRKKVSE